LISFDVGDGFLVDLGLMGTSLFLGGVNFDEKLVLVYKKSGGADFAPYTEKDSGNGFRSLLSVQIEPKQGKIRVPLHRKYEKFVGERSQKTGRP
jgi:hypothetical protein